MKYLHDAQALVRLREEGLKWEKESIGFLSSRPGMAMSPLCVFKVGTQSPQAAKTTVCDLGFSAIVIVLLVIKRNFCFKRN